MMKRKFSFHLPPVKVPSKPDLRANPAPEPVPAPVPAPAVKSPRAKHHRSKDSITSLNNAFISRQRIDPKTEQELRAACALILQNFKSSDHDVADADPKLDFSLPHTQRARHQHRTEASQVKVHRPTGAPPESKVSHHAKKHSQSQVVESASKNHPELPVRANTGRRRGDRDDMERPHKEMEAKRHVKPLTHNAPRQPFARTETDSDDAKSLATPLTASTDAHLHNGSTAPTSVAVTNRSSKRASRQLENPAAVADAQAAEWMRQELEKRRQQMASQPQYAQNAMDRPPSRSASIRSGIKEYIFPGSRNLSRTQSRESLRSQSSAQAPRTGSSQGWRSWGLHRLSTSRGSSRPTSSNGRSERSEQDRKADLNLNRALPPLPSLDTWKDPEARKKHSKSQVQGAHIATMMRTQDQQQSYAAAVREHRRSGSDSLATRFATTYSQSSTRVKSPTQQSFSQSGAALVPQNLHMDFDQAMSTMASQNIDDQLKFRLNGEVLHRSTSTMSRSGHDAHGLAPNFSRKISMDVAPFDPTSDSSDSPYTNTVHVSSAHPHKKEEQKSKLKKVLSGWMLKKDKKEDWMHKVQKDGVRSGVMTQDEAAFPVVRY